MVKWAEAGAVEGSRGDTWWRWVELHDWHGRWADGAAGIRVHEIRVHVGEALEICLVDAGKN